MTAIIGCAEFENHWSSWAAVAVINAGSVTGET